jgi:hypothetical protein
LIDLASISYKILYNLLIIFCIPEYVNCVVKVAYHSVVAM